MKNMPLKKIKYIKSTKKNSIAMIQILEKEYPEAYCGLNFNSPIELVVALILAAQCTDKRVNAIVPILFEKYHDVYALSKADISDIQKIIKPCGFYINKAQSICTSANIIVNNFNGKVPNTMQTLCTLRGIGRKSSNIILQECFKTTVGIAVDTHVTRISRKAGFSNGNTPVKIEEELTKKFDKIYWNKINHILVLHGRAVCIARRPKCDICCIKALCPKNN
ncbi:MAG: endonuclease III [Clostridia bacterium]